MKNKTIYMNEPLEKLEAATKKQGVPFSSRLGEIVERYEIIMDLETVPEFTSEEMEILSEVICGAVIDRRKIRGLHLDILDATLGSPSEKEKLYEKIEPMTPGQLLKVIEQMGQ